MGDFLKTSNIGSLLIPFAAGVASAFSPYAARGVAAGASLMKAMDDAARARRLDELLPFQAQLYQTQAEAQKAAIEANKQKTQYYASQMDKPTPISHQPYGIYLLQKSPEGKWQVVKAAEPYHGSPEEMEAMRQKTGIQLQADLAKIQAQGQNQLQLEAFRQKFQEGFKDKNEMARTYQAIQNAKKAELQALEAQKYMMDPAEYNRKLQEVRESYDPMLMQLEESLGLKRGTPQTQQQTPAAPAPGFVPWGRDQQGRIIYYNPSTGKYIR